MGNTNANMHRAKKAKNDEFYTLYEDIEKEVINYKDQLSGKTIYCNCDDWERSNFYKYFKNNFKELQLKGLVATCYIEDGKGKIARYDGEKETTGLLKGNGDFRSEECKAIARESDIIITNPPFSLFRDFIKVMQEV